MKRPAGIASIDHDPEFTVPQSIPSMIERHKGLMTAKKLAPLLGMPLPTLYQWTAQGRMPSFNLAGTIKFDPKQIAAWLRARAKGQQQQQRKANAA